LPAESLLFLAGNTSALGEFTLPGREYFCLRRAYSSWSGILLPFESLLFLAGNSSALGEFTLPGWEYFCLRRAYSSWPGILLSKEILLFPTGNSSVSGGFFLNQERKNSRKPGIPDYSRPGRVYVYGWSYRIPSW
jgi:hypothetical protein